MGMCESFCRKSIHFRLQFLQISMRSRGERAFHKLRKCVEALQKSPMLSLNSKLSGSNGRLLRRLSIIDLFCLTSFAIEASFNSPSESPGHSMEASKTKVFNIHKQFVSLLVSFIEMFLRPRKQQFPIINSNIEHEQINSQKIEINYKNFSLLHHPLRAGAYSGTIKFSPNCQFSINSFTALLIESWKKGRRKDRQELNIDCLIVIFPI